MNIFILDKTPYLAARYHCDKHVVKMILETAQLLSTAHLVLDGDDTPLKDKLYKKTHQNHPSAVWVRESVENYMWLVSLFGHLHDEWQHRWGHAHDHASFRKLMYTESHINGTTWNPPKNIERGGLTPFKLCMPEEYKDDLDPVQSYRDYYVNEKRDLLQYTKREAPFWVRDHEARMGNAENGWT